VLRSLDDTRVPFDNNGRTRPADGEVAAEDLRVLAHVGRGGAWAELLRDSRRRGMRAPVVMVGDGALGLWRALSEVFPETRE
jgi:hypothetical protein